MRCFIKKFNQKAVMWTPNNMEMNIGYLEYVKKTCMSCLKERGYLFLNDVYDLLSLPRTKEGALYGWVYDAGPKKEETYSNSISFNDGGFQYETEEDGFTLYIIVDRIIFDMLKDEGE